MSVSVRGNHVAVEADGKHIVSTTGEIFQLLPVILCNVYICPCVSLSVRNRLLNHVYYGDETFTGDSMVLE